MQAEKVLFLEGWGGWGGGYICSSFSGMSERERMKKGETKH